MKFGIAICTYNRIDILSETIKKVQTYTTCDYELLVVDDGSSDQTVKFLCENKIQFISCKNKGIAWNKNRAIFILKNLLHCDAFIILEDDTYPTKKDWQQPWIEATLQWGHVNFAASHFPLGIYINGDGTPLLPYQTAHISAQCAGFSSQAIDAVGYMDTRFKGYGLEHVEHSIRLVKGGYGGYAPKKRWDTIFYLIKSDLNILLINENEQQHGNKNSNSNIFIALQQEQIYRNPWINDEERIVFLSEVRSFLNSTLINVFYIKNDEGFKLCFNEAKKQMIFYNQETIMNNNIIHNVFIYYDGNKISFGIQKNDRILFLYIKNEQEDIEIVENIHFCEDVKILTDVKNGFYFKKQNKFASCNKNQNNIFLFNKENNKEWEKFYFDFEEKLYI